MDSEEEACLECTKKCLLIHKKKRHSIPDITSFFKVMIGDKFSEILLLPPKFAHTVVALVGEKTHLEDLSGHQWEVTVSNVNGSLAFHLGWHAFALDHCLEIGDFVVFHHIMGSHFVAQIYDRTGCEKSEYSENRQQKKTMRNKSTSSNGCALRTIDKGLLNEQVSSTSVEIIQSECDAADVEKVPMVEENTSNCETRNFKLKPVSKAGYVEEPYYMINRDLGYKRGEYRSSIFDLSNFEMPNSADRSKKTVAGDGKSPHHADKLLILKTEAVVAGEETVAEEVRRELVGEDASNFETTEKNKDANVMEKNISQHSKDSCDNRASGQFLTRSATELRENRKDSSDLRNEGIKELQISGIRSNTHSIDMKSIKKESVEIITSQFHGPEEMTGEKALKLRKGLHHQSLDPTRKDSDKVYKVVKTEAVDFNGPPPPIAANLSCFAGKEAKSFLELQTSLPSISYRGRIRMERKVVLLRDPDARLWPVLYHERHGFKVLARGWEDFSRTNNIQPGDECVFTLENEIESIYAVRIVHQQR